MCLESNFVNSIGIKIIAFFFIFSKLGFNMASTLLFLNKHIGYRSNYLNYFCPFLIVCVKEGTSALFMMSSLSILINI